MKVSLGYRTFPYWLGDDSPSAIDFASTTTTPTPLEAVMKLFLIRHGETVDNVAQL